MLYIGTKKENKAKRTIIKLTIDELIQSLRETPG
jgi:hypothetical protein